MVHQRHQLALLLLVSLVSFSIPSTAEAGPLLDWLFQRNRSQGLAGNTPGLGGNTSGSLFNNSCLNCLTGRRGATTGYGTVGGFAGNAANQNRANPNAAPNAFAGQQNPNPNATTAGFAPQGGCGAGWCQQTVVRYIPQTAYRTAYQPVPVTTYKTSTSINPANGLPRTCTRPCTTYSYQARRVPYTTYRPVYTTVPVADTFGQQQQQQPNVAGFAPPQAPSYNQTYAYQPQTPAGPGCASCQNQGTVGNYGGGYSNWSAVPGYTPGNTTNLPPAYAGAPPAAGSPWGNAPLSAPQTSSTPWRDVAPSGSVSGATPWQDYGDTSSSNFDATPWQNSGSGTRAPSGGSFQGGTPADDRPRLNRPEYPDDYGQKQQSTFRPLEPKPMPESMRRRINGTSNSFEPSESSYLDNQAYGRDYAASRSDLFRTPTEQGYAPSNSPINAPTNQGYDRADERNRDYFRGGIRDYDRSQPPTWSDINDKTAHRDGRGGGSMPLIEEETTRTRYAAAPIQWQSEPSDRRSSRDQDWRNDSYRLRFGASRSSGWTPVR